MNLSKDKDKETDNRNLIAAYKYWKTEAIVADLESRRHSFSVLCLNIHQELNLGNCLRSFNAFLGTRFYYYGKRHWDRRGAVGVHNYTKVTHLDDAGLEELLRKSNVVGVDNVPSAQSIDDFVWPDNPLIVMGEECGGIGPLLNRCNSIVYIPQYGSVRSLNVASAACVVMNDWCRKNIKKVS